MKDTARAAAQVRRHAGERLHGLADLASSSSRSRVTTTPRSSTATRHSPGRGGQDPRRLRRRGRPLRPGRASDRDAYNFVTTEKTLAALGRRPHSASTSTLPISHAAPGHGQFALKFGDRIYHMHSRTRRTARRSRSILASHLNFGEQARGWDFVSQGHGDVDFGALFRALNRIGCAGPLYHRWEDSGWIASTGPRTLSLSYGHRLPRSSLALTRCAGDAASRRVAPTPAIGDMLPGDIPAHSRTEGARRRSPFGASGLRATD